MKVNYTILAPERKGTSIKINLTEEDTNRSGILIADLKPFYDFSSDYQNKIAFDFFLLSTLVYGIDNLLDRYIYSIDGWTREIEFTFPVVNLDKWNAVKEELENALCFLTGDIWSISFEQMPYTAPLFVNNEKRRKYPSFKLSNSPYEAVSLFSGGLDSLIGIVNYFADNPTKKLLLVSHYDSNSGGPNSDQIRLTRQFNKKYIKNYNWIQTGVGLQLLSGISREPSYRSRSLMFIALGVYFASRHNDTELVIPENGTISLNHPLSASRRGSLSTRTTHPYLLDSLRAILSKLAINVRLKNPYELFTKGEMMRDTSDLPFIQGALLDSVSCGKRGRKSHWDRREGISHCGHCMPCIYRRAALHKVNLDNQPYGIDIFNPDKGWEYAKNLPDISALVNYISTPITEEQVERNLLINASFPIEKLSDYTNVVVKTRDEIKEWVRAKANVETKRSFGI
jgi:7-cyano-7-deazaguanine synthase in queuosine biosynthesis